MICSFGPSAVATSLQSVIMDEEEEPSFGDEKGAAAEDGPTEAAATSAGLGHGLEAVVLRAEHGNQSS